MTTNVPFFQFSHSLKTWEKQRRNLAPSKLRKNAHGRIEQLFE